MATLRLEIVTPETTAYSEDVQKVNLGFIRSTSPC